LKKNVLNKREKFEDLSHTAFATRVMLAQSHVWSGCFGVKILRHYQTPKC